MVVLVESQTAADGKRRPLRQYRRAGIPLFLGRIEIAFISVQRKDSLLRLELRLLQADHVGVFLRTVVQKALAEAGAQTVDVP